MSELLKVVENETWEKLGDGRDGEREAKFGPIIAEEVFTVLDLFKWMGLWESAEYYRDKWYKHQKEAKETITLEEQSITSESDWAPAPETEEERRRREWDEVWADVPIQPNDPRLPPWQVDPWARNQPSRYQEISGTAIPQRSDNPEPTSPITKLGDGELKPIPVETRPSYEQEASRPSSLQRSDSPEPCSPTKTREDGPTPDPSNDKLERIPASIEHVEDDLEPKTSTTPSLEVKTSAMLNETPLDAKTSTKLTRSQLGELQRALMGDIDSNVSETGSLAQE